MRTIDIHEAKAHLLKLVEQAARGESFLIATSGRPRVMVIPVESPEGRQAARCDAVAKSFSRLRPASGQ